MPQKQLILHVGFHKSGTSSLQEALHIQREELLTQGILYPEIGKKAHHRIAWALSQKTWGWKGRGGEKTPFRLFRKLARSINSSKRQTIVLSSEFLSELSMDQIQFISESVSNREIKVLFTIRPLVKLLASSYQQYLKYGTKTDYEGWLHSVLDEPGVSKVNPTFWRRHMHGDVISRWSEVFGAGALTVLVVDEQKPEFLFEEMNQFLGLSSGFLKQQQTGTNRSLSLEEVSLLLRINNTFPKDRVWQEYLVFIRNGYVRQLTDFVPVSKDSGKLPTPKWAIEKANEVASRSRRLIEGLGVNVRGDLSSLDTASVLEGNPEYSTVIDVETVAQAMLGFDKRLVNKVPVKWLLSSVRKRLGDLVRQIRYR